MKSEKVGDQVYIKMDGELRRLINLEHEFRNNVNTFSPLKVLWNLIKDEKRAKKRVVYRIMITLGFDEQEISEGLYKLFSKKKIKEDGDEYVIL